MWHLEQDFNDTKGKNIRTFLFFSSFYNYNLTYFRMLLLKWTFYAEGRKQHTWKEKVPQRSHVGQGGQSTTKTDLVIIFPRLGRKMPSPFFSGVKEGESDKDLGQQLIQMRIQMRPKEASGQLRSHRQLAALNSLC